MLVGVAVTLLVGSAAAVASPGPRSVDRLASPAVAGLEAQRLLAVPVEADATLDAGAATLPSGAATTLTVSRSPDRDALLRVDLRAWGGGAPAGLRLHPDPALAAGSSVDVDLSWLSDTTWDEATVTAATAPRVDGAARRVHGTVGADGWVTFDVAGVVGGDARVTLRLHAVGAAVTFDARESGDAPHLLVGVGVDARGAGDTVRVWAVGDLACRGGDAVTDDACHQWAVSNLVAADPTADLFLALGDLQYPAGAYADFQSGYAPSYGRLLPITVPTPGNHEYGTAGAAGYRAYFGTGVPGGWRSLDVGATWHVVVLDSNCDEVGCGVGSEQERWLRADLAASTRPCTIGVWHHPRFSSGAHYGVDADVAALWRALADDHAEIVLNGHDHVYERFHRQTVDGSIDASGMRQFTVGTGGRSLYTFGAPLPSSSVRLATFGALRLDLSATGYTWAFVDEAGAVLDSGSGSCA